MCLFLFSCLTLTCIRDTKKMMNDRANGAFIAGEYLKFIETKDTILVKQFVAFVPHK